MSRRAAILGLGRRGETWARLLHHAGWEVTWFDPEPASRDLSVVRAGTISDCVAGADWVLVAVPERIELIRSVVQRVQASAPDGAVIAVASDRHKIDALQGCALRPEYVIRVGRRPEGGFLADLSPRNTGTTRSEATEVLAALAALDGLEPAHAQPDAPPDAETA